MPKQRPKPTGNSLLPFFLVLQIRQSYFRKFPYLKIIQLHLSGNLSRASADQVLLLPGDKLHFPEASSSAERVLPATGGLGKPKDASASFPGKRAHRRGCLTLHPEMARRQDEARVGAPLRVEGQPDAEVRLILYHWTHSFSSQKVTTRSRGPRSGSAPGQLPRGGGGPAVA